MAAITLALLGAGNRGADAYGRYAFRHPEEYRFVAVAEPRKDRRESFRRPIGIPAEHAFATWEDLLTRPRLADALIVATQDRMHFAPAMAALALGYHILLEKPMSPVPGECLTLAEEAGRRRQILLVAHVLRYTPFFTTIRRLLDEGHLGRIICRSAQRERGLLAHGPQLRPGQLAPRRGYQPDDPGEELPRPGYPPLAGRR